MITLKSKITIKIISYYFINPNKSHYINELAHILEVDPGNLFRKLKDLEKEGLLCSELQGNQRYFFLNKKYPFLSEYKKIYESKFGLVEILKEKLIKISGVKEAYIFGSFAKGDFSEESDIDLLLIGDHDYDEISPIISAVEKKIKREINVVDFASQEFLKKKKQGDDFIKNIFLGKVIKIV